MGTWEQALGGQRGSLQHTRRLPSTRDSSERRPEPLSARDTGDDTVKGCAAKTRV